MTPAELRLARARLGLTQAGLAQALELGLHGARTVRWHEGKPETHSIPGPWAVALRLMNEVRDLDFYASKASALLD